MVAMGFLCTHIYLLEPTTLLFNEYIIIKNVRAKTLKLTLKEKQSRQEENPIEFVIALTFHLLFVNSAWNSRDPRLCDANTAMPLKRRRWLGLGRPWKAVAVLNMTMGWYFFTIASKENDRKSLIRHWFHFLCTSIQTTIHNLAQSSPDQTSSSSISLWPIDQCHDLINMYVDIFLPPSIAVHLLQIPSIGYHWSRRLYPLLLLFREKFVTILLESRFDVRYQRDFLSITLLYIETWQSHLF